MTAFQPSVDYSANCLSDSLAPESHFLQTLFAEFRKKGIQYAVLRNYEMLPCGTDGSDLDILFLPEYVTIVIATTIDSVAVARGTILGACLIHQFSKLSVFGKSACFGWWGLQLDLFFEIKYGGTVDLLETSLIQNVPSSRRNVKILPSHVASTLGVLKELLNNNTAPTRYLDPARWLNPREWDEINKWFAPIGEKGVSLLRSAIIETQTDSERKGISRRLRRHLLWRAFCRSPFRYIVKRLQVFFSKISRLLHPSGLFLAVLGTDGAGKSTVISAIEPVLSSATHGAFYVKHLRPGLLPPLARFRGVRSEQEGPVTNPHGSTTSGIIGSVVRILYLLGDYILGYWILLRPQIAKQPAVFVFDRYAYDMTLDPKRFRIGLPTKISGWLAKLAPKPDIIFCLHAPPEVISSRKSELSRAEIERQLQVLRQFADNEPRAVLISTDGTIDEVRDQVLETLFQFCRKRTERTFPGARS